jgi:TonB-dependent receptor
LFEKLVQNLIFQGDKQMNTMRMKGRGALFALFVVSSFLYAAPSGKISGYVFDSQDKKPLPGANVFLRGTTLGASTDLNGKFVIPKVPAGSYKLMIRYIGYQSKTIDILVAEDQELKQNITLDPEAVEGEAIVVTAQAEGQLGAINQQLASDKIVNIVSEQRIQELPDFNAAQAISRLPGVSTLESSGEANKVVIRGLAPQYNAISVEGVKLASTGSTQIGAASQGGTSGSINNDRSVDLSMVTPYMIKSIAVYKSLTPDLNANAIGGIVNMELREAPSELHYDLLWQSGYTQKSDKYGNYRAIGAASKRFFNDKFGVYFLGNAENYDRDADNMNAVYGINNTRKSPTTGYSQVSVQNVQLNRHIETRKRFGGNLIMDYKLPSGSIKSINLFTRLNSQYQDHRSTLDYDGKNLNFSYRQGDNNIDLAVSSLDFKYDLGLLQMDLKVANTYSFNSLPQSLDLQFSQTGGIVGVVPVDTVPDSLTKLIKYRGPESTFLGNVTLFDTKYKENNQSYKANLKFPFNFRSFFSGYLKFGGEYKHDYHVNDQNTPYVRLDRGSGIQRALMDDLVARFGVDYETSTGQFAASSFTSTDANLFKTFLDDRFGKFYWAADPNVLLQMAKYLVSNPAYSGTNVGGWFDGLYQQLPNDYRYTEYYSAGYLMSELNFLDFMVVGGVRYEKDKSKFKAYNLVDGRDPRTQTADTVAVYPKNEFWLPMVQVKYTPFDWVDLRYAYTKTLARPDYHQLSPHFNMDYSHNNVWAGNPDLKPAQSFNHDVVLSFHGNKLGLLSIGGFRKRVKEFTYYTQYKLHVKREESAPGLRTVESFDPPPKDGATLYTYVNSPYEASVKGIEADFQTSLWYLPFPLKGVVLGINYTHIVSKARYPWRDDKTIFKTVPRRQTYTVVIDSTRTGRLIFQPDDILSSYIGFDYKGFSTRLSFIFQGNSVSGIGAFPEQDGFTRDYFRMDASAKQKLPWSGSEIYLDFYNLNSETNTSAQRSIGGFTTERNYGLTANLGLRYRH